ncbi:hypothetical protein [Mesorhizobium sp.]|uniref:hypothetical protein n=1 Tax=Mesorhizobium sp. TaxID=1871066 RepID=UPI0025C33B65|nr:hypothetical protein [Mesorhizobium sp.]
MRSTVPSGILVGSLPASGLPAWTPKGPDETTKVTAKAVTRAPNLLLEILSTTDILVFSNSGMVLNSQFSMSMDILTLKVSDAVVCSLKEMLFVSNAHLGHVSLTPRRVRRSGLRSDRCLLEFEISLG